MTEPVIIGNATLYLGDCREVIPSLTKVDCIITDPPFSATTHGNSRSNMSGLIHPLRIDFDPVDLPYVCSLLESLGDKCDRWFIATLDWRHITELSKSCPEPWEFVRFGVWVKPNPMPQISADRPANGWDGIMYLHNKASKKAWYGGGSHGNFIAPVVSDGLHPTGKPLIMLQTMIKKFTERGNTVFDCFMGSGTTGHAAVSMGRKFIGCEIDQKYFDIACERIENAQRQARMFA